MEKNVFFKEVVKMIKLGVNPDYYFGLSSSKERIKYDKLAYYYNKKILSFLGYLEDMNGYVSNKKGIREVTVEEFFTRSKAIGVTPDELMGLKPIEILNKCTPKYFNLRLKYLMIKNQKTIDDISYETKISRFSLLSFLDHKVKSTKIVNLVKLSNSLDTNIAYLSGLSDNEEKLSFREYNRAKHIERIKLIIEQNPNVLEKILLTGDRNNWGRLVESKNKIYLLSKELDCSIEYILAID